MLREPDRFDPKELRREKQADREKDCAELELARREGRKLKLANGVFDALDLRRARIIYPESRRKV
jgi:hypothetical protein